MGEELTVIFSGDKYEKTIIGWSFRQFSFKLLMVSNTLFTKPLHDQNGDSFSNKLHCFIMVFKNKFALFCTIQINLSGMPSSPNSSP